MTIKFHPRLPWLHPKSPGLSTVPCRAWLACAVHRSSASTKPSAPSVCLRRLGRLRPVKPWEDGLEMTVVDFSFLT